MLAILAATLGLFGVAPGAPQTLYVAPTGSDTADCRTPSTACRSFNRGYRAASPGDVVELAAGTYRGPQHFSHDSSKRSRHDVVVRPAPGARVVVDCRDESNCLATEGADHLTVRGVTTAMLAPVAGMPRQAGVALDRGSVDVTFQDVDAGHVFIAGSNQSVIGGDYGPTVDNVSKIADDVGENVLIDGARFHHHLEYEDHMECIALYGARGVVIRRSRFDTCSVFAIFGAPNVDEHYRDVVIENNFFSNSGSAAMSTHVKVSSHGGDCSNFLVRHNVFVDDGVIADCGTKAGTASNMRWVSNIFTSSSGCPGGPYVFDYNVIERGRRCGPHDVVVGEGRAGFVDRAGLDFHLRPDSPAIDRGSPGGAPASDIDGDRRPAGSAPDAGADEFGAGRGAPQGDRSRPRLEVRLRAVRRGRIVFVARCSETCRLTARVRNRRGGRVVGRLERRLAGGRQRRLTVAVRRGRLPRGRRVRLTLRVTATDGAGNSRTVSRRLTIRR